MTTRKHHRAIGLTLGLLVGAHLLGASSLLARTVEFRGQAYDAKTGVFLYTEHHKETYVGGKHVYSDVYYRRRDGSAFAHKRITFSESRIAPNYKLTDYRSGYVEGLRKNAGRSVTMFSRRSKTDKLKSAQTVLPGPGVVDGGFDYFIRDNWSTLLGGKTMTVNFAVPIELDYFRFQIKKVATRNAGDETLHTFEFSIASRFLAMFAESILVTYDSNRRLREFRGISNINDDSGKSHRARIVFGSQ